MNKKQMSLSIVLLSFVGVQQAALVTIGQAAVAGANHTLFQLGAVSTITAANIAAAATRGNIFAAKSTQEVAKTSSFGAFKAAIAAKATSAFNASKNGVNAGVELVKANPKKSAAAGLAVLALGYGCYKYGVFGTIWNKLTGLFKKSEVTEVEVAEGKAVTNDAAATQQSVKPAQMTLKEARAKGFVMTRGHGAQVLWTGKGDKSKVAHLLK